MIHTALLTVALYAAVVTIGDVPVGSARALVAAVFCAVLATLLLNPPIPKD